MMAAETFAGKSVALFGLGGSGVATARALKAGGALVTAWDDNPESVGKANAEGVCTADLRHADWSRFASFVLSPGVPLTHPKPHWTVDLARGAGVEIIGDIELFARERAAIAPDAPFIAVELSATGAGDEQALTFRTNVGDVVEAGSEHPLRFVDEPETGGLKPYLHVRGRLEALVARPVMYELVELGEEIEIGGRAMFAVRSKGEVFPIMPADKLKRMSS